MHYEFTNDDCERARICCCGFCKRRYVVDGAEVRDCDFGDCRTRPVTQCPRFGYPVCTRHAHVNCYHAADAECTTLRAAP